MGTFADMKLVLLSILVALIWIRSAALPIKKQQCWIIRYSHLPQKRRLLEVVEERKIKRTKLNKDLLIQMNEYSNEYLFTTNAF